MIFGFSHYPIGTRAPTKRASGDHADRDEKSPPASQTSAQVYDLAHQRRSFAGRIELNGASLG